MHVFLTLFRRELGAFFFSFTGYVVIAAAAFLIGLGLVSTVDGLRDQPSGMPMTQLFMGTFYFWIILLPATPMITMRLFAQEKLTGTFETLMTTPVSDLQVVLAKFAAAWVFYLLMWLPLFGGMLTLRQSLGDPRLLDTGSASGLLIGLGLLGGVYVSMGAFSSSLTRSQAMAAMMSLALGVALFLLALWNVRAPLDNGLAHQALAQFALIRHMEDFVRGIVDTRHVVFYVSLTVFFLFLTLRVVESRRWK